jgi:hypothetical protein
MDHLLETATQLLPHIHAAGTAGDGASTEDVLQHLRASLYTAVFDVWRRRDEAARAFRDAKVARYEQEDEKTKEPPETARAAPGILELHLLADLLARAPTIIPAALAAAGEARFYPTFLEYLMQSIDEIVNPPRLSVWKRIAASEHINLIEDRRRRVSEIVMTTKAWKEVDPKKPPRASDRKGGAPPEGAGGFTASMLGVDDLRARAAQVKEQCRLAADYILEKTGFVNAEWERLNDFFAEEQALVDRFRDSLRRELLIDPVLVRRLVDATAVAVPFEVALDAELLEIEHSRIARGIDPLRPGAAIHATRRAADMDTLGVALSGGGVRSATFNLGVLQGLAQCDLLRRVDYLSTVSGGGYIGAWLASWSKRVRGGRGVAAVQERLRTEPLTEPDALSVRAVRFLREFSNYLTPQSGVFTADTWTMVAIWMRNTLLNQAVLILTLCGILGVPWMLWVIQFSLTAQTSSAAGPAALRACEPGLFATSPVVMTTAAVLLLYASAIAGQQLRRFGLSGVDRRRMRDEMLSQGGVLFGIVAPVLASAALITTALFNALGCRGGAFTWRAVAELSVMFAASMTVVAVGGHYYRCFFADRVSTRVTTALRRRLIFWAAVIIGVGILGSSVGGATALVAISAAVGAWLKDTGQAPGYVSLPFVAIGTPMVVGAFSLMIVLKIGILGRNLYDEHREWWSRVGAWLNIVTLGWVVLCALSLFSPHLVSLVERMSGKFIAASGGVLWAAWTAAGVFLGKRETVASVDASAIQTRLRVWIVAAAPYAFILGLLILLSAAMFELVSREAPETLRPAALLQPHWLLGNHFHWMLFLPPALFITAFVLSWRVDVNEFSMHHFYKNRLVRCYLGASRDQRADRPERTPDPFTGFDPGDDLKLAYLRMRPAGNDPVIRAAKTRDNAEDILDYVGPLPIVNTALNLVKGDDLAWQERRAQSFVFTPFYSGYDYRHRGSVESRHAPYGFRQTAFFGYPPFGVGLGTAVAISGAAASPNMGYHSSPPAAFLMTMFNARLGWWMGNPRDKHNWLRSGPRRGLLYLLNELFGLTNDRTHFVNLSDGGHFENLGIYELVRRRCRYIIACDAEQDASMHFNGLGNAIRKCRTDLGAEISVSATRIRPANGLLSPLHCVLGDITYADGEKGTLLYLKASVTGDEPADVLEYAARETAFPHHSTLTDQFFDESQFESYRKLGFHVAHTAFAAPIRSAQNEPRNDTHDQLAAIFAHMRDYWHPGNPALAERRSAHAEQYDALLDRIMSDQTLAFVDDAFFQGAGAGAGPGPLPQRPRLFVGALMLDLMQRVYIDLDLDNDRDHPHNSGWITIFKRWKRHTAVTEAWAASEDDYSRPFRWFFRSL